MIGHIDYVKENITDYFLNNISEWCSNFPDRAGSMVGDFVCTKNLLMSVKDSDFLFYLNEIKSIVEKKINKTLIYNYVHMIDYSKGGEIKIHSHDHVEDYVYVLYLNSCSDGATFYVHDDKEFEVSPEKNKLFCYPSYLPHGSRYSSNKKILVGGLKFL